MYDQFYGFEGRPFQLTPDPDFYFESLTHRKALSYLGYGLAQGEGFIVITGDIGAGKTTLVSHLMATIDTARLNASTIVTSKLNGNDLIKMAATSFGLDVEGFDKPAALNAIEQFLHAEARAGRRCLLVVDEAQCLSVDALEELRMLSNFQLGSTALLQIFLLGQPEFRDLVHDSAQLEQLRQRIIATHHLQPMESEEVKPYIEHRLNCAGWSGNPKFDENVYDIMYSETNGVPRQLNILMQRVLLMGAVEQLQSIDADMIKAVIADMSGEPFEYEAPLSAKAGPNDIPQAMYDKQAQEAEDHNNIKDELDDISSKEKEVASQKDQSQVPIAANGEASLSHVNDELLETTDDVDDSKYVNIAIDDYHKLIDRIDMLEVKLSEHDVTLRQTLSMMIQWMEDNEEIQYGANKAA